VIAIFVRLTFGIGCLVGLGVWVGQTEPPPDQQVQNQHDEHDRVPSAELPVLLCRVEVRRELQVDADQARQIDQMLTELVDRLERQSPRTEQCDYAEVGPSDAEATQIAIRDFAQLAVDEATRSLDHVLTDRQLERLGQIRFQREGLIALQRSEMVERLNLSKVQTGRLQQLPAYGLSPSAPADARSQCEAAVTSILTGRQWRQWQDITGQPLAIAYQDRADHEFLLMQWLWGFDSLVRPQ
jgi:hypothetical protein